MRKSLLYDLDNAPGYILQQPFFGQVQQDVFIFTGDVASNIRLLNEEITDEQIKNASKEVNAAHFIEQMPNQYHEPVSERGSTLSQGQRQLLSFARTPTCAY